MTKKGTIVGFNGSWMSGLATLILEDDQVFCDNGATVRVLDAAYPGFITEGHRVDDSVIRGKVIYYDTDFMGVLEAFTPEEMWTGPELDESQTNLEEWL